MTAASSSVDLLLHPVRLRILQAFLGEHDLTTGQLQVRLPEVASATLYRQVALLVEAGVLEVVAERKVRGAVERTLRLRAERTAVDPAELATMTEEEHRAAFLAFVAGLLADFDRYLAGEAVDLLADRVGYRQAGFYATDDELDAAVAALNAALAPVLLAGPGPGRTRRLLSTVLVPSRDDPPPGDAAPPEP